MLTKNYKYFLTKEYIPNILVLIVAALATSLLLLKTFDLLDSYKIINIF